MAPGVRILDVGSGRRPALSPPERAPNCYYVGFDIDADELALAADGYSEAIAGDITHGLPDHLRGQFDMVLSFQALEHFADVPAAFEAMRDALRPGGVAIVQTSGAFGLLPAMVNRVLPRRLSLWLLARLTGRDPATVFPAVYHRCWARALRKCLDEWTEVEVRPLQQGGFYLLNVPLLLWPYLLWEAIVIRARWDNLATHYLISAQRPETRLSDGHHQNPSQ